MSKEESRIQEEWAWVDAHPNHYNGPAHMEDVKHNIRVNYDIREIEAELRKKENKDNPELLEKIRQLASTRRYGNSPSCPSIKVPDIPPPKGKDVA